MFRDKEHGWFIARRYIKALKRALNENKGHLFYVLLNRREREQYYISRDRHLQDDFFLYCQMAIEKFGYTRVLLEAPKESI